MDPENKGRILEESMYNAFQSLPCIQRIVHETELIKVLGYQASSIDYMLETDEGWIVLQCKWKGSKRREDKDIFNFIRSIQFIRSQCKWFKEKPMLFGIWASKMHPFQDNCDLLMQHQVIALSHPAMSELVKLTQATLVKVISEHSYV